jgi:hypothetical protein
MPKYISPENEMYVPIIARYVVYNRYQYPLCTGLRFELCRCKSGAGAGDADVDCGYDAAGYASRCSELRHAGAATNGAVAGAGAMNGADVDGANAAAVARGDDAPQTKVGALRDLGLWIALAAQSLDALGAPGVLEAQTTRAQMTAPVALGVLGAQEAREAQTKKAQTIQNHMFQQHLENGYANDAL